MVDVRDFRSRQLRKNPLFPDGPFREFPNPQAPHVDLKRLESMLQTQGKRLDALEEQTEKRRKPKAKVVSTHRSMVSAVYSGKCPCCMGPLEHPEVDHFSSRAWSGLHDTWLICGTCNKDLYHGNLVRAEVQPRFATYQAHLKKFIGGEQLSLVSRMRIRPVKPVR